jgi:hypothetical protein
VGCALGTVTGSSLFTGGSTKQHVIDANTQIMKKGQMRGASALKTGMHVKVGGVTRSDSSIQCSSVQNMGGGMM